MGAEVHDGGAAAGGLTADVVVSRRLAPDDLDDIARAFDALGVAAALRTVPSRRGDSVTWLALVALPLSGFLTTLGTNLATDAYKVLRDSTERVLSRGKRAGVRGPLVLEDPNTGTRIVLEADMPAEAYRALLGMDLSAVEEGATLRFDVAAERWSAVAP
jgi:hypothetical protein